VALSAAQRLEVEYKRYIQERANKAKTVLLVGRAVKPSAAKRAKKGTIHPPAHALFHAFLNIARAIR
jgi:hypothetical protein